MEINFETIGESHIAINISAAGELHIAIKTAKGHTAVISGHGLTAWGIQEVDTSEFSEAINKLRHSLRK